MSHRVFKSTLKYSRLFPFSHPYYYLIGWGPHSLFPRSLCKPFLDTQYLSCPVYSLNATFSLQNLSYSQKNWLSMVYRKPRDCKPGPSAGHTLPLTSLYLLNAMPQFCLSIGLGFWSESDVLFYSKEWDPKGETYM